MAYTLGNWYYFEAFGGNSGLFLNREGSGALQNHQNISIYRNTTGTANNPDHQFRLVEARHNGVIEGCSIRSLLNEAYGLNIYGYGSDMTAEANCNLAIVGGTTSAASNYNDTLIDLLTVDGDQMLYRIKLIKHPGLFLTATSNSNNADVRWMKESGGSNQLWKLRTSETGSGSGGGTAIDMPVCLSQKQAPTPWLRDYGCAVTCGIDIASYYDGVNYAFEDFSGCWNEERGYFWTTPRGWSLLRDNSPNGMSRADTVAYVKRYIQNGIPAACHCIGANGKEHWVVAYAYGDGSDWNCIQCLDPADGTRKTMQAAMNYSYVTGGVDRIQAKRILA